MSIKRKKNSVYIEKFKTPNRIKNLCTKEWCEIFKNELDRIFKLNPDETCDCTYFHLEATSGWYGAFKNACDKHPHKHMGVGLFRYYEPLPWYDSDLFDDEIMELMVDKLNIPRKDVGDYLDETYNPDEYWIEGKDYRWVFKKKLKDVTVYEQEIIDFEL